MPDLPELCGKFYHSPNGEQALCVILDVQMGISQSGMQYIDQIKVQRQSDNVTGWTPPRWIRYGRHIQQRIQAYEQQFSEAGGAA
jgi:hypothetical protein